VSLRTFFGTILNDTNYTAAWVAGGTERESLIDNNRDLTFNERRILKTGSDLLISMRILLYESVGHGFPPGKPGEPPPGPPTPP
jgi:hypothetical protein